MIFDSETTICEKYKRKANPFIKDNWVVAEGWKFEGDSQCSYRYMDEPTSKSSYLAIPDDVGVLFAVLSLSLVAYMDIERLYDLWWVHVLAVEGDAVLPQLFLCSLDVACLEGLCFLLFDGHQDIAEFVLIYVGKLTAFSIALKLHQALLEHLLAIRSDPHAGKMRHSFRGVE